MRGHEALPLLRQTTLLLALLTIALGLATRPLKHVSDGLGSALGDALYGALAYLLVTLALPRVDPVRRLIIATACTWAVEVSQLWQTPLLDAFRHTTLGALSIGGTFSLGDMGWYLAGTGAACLAENRFRRRSTENK